MHVPDPHTGSPDVKLDEKEFKRRFLAQYVDPGFDGLRAELDRYIGYWKPYATNHEELDRDEMIQEETRNAARTLLEGVLANRAGKLAAAGADLEQPRQK